MATVTDVLLPANGSNIDRITIQSISGPAFTSAPVIGTGAYPHMPIAVTTHVFLAGGRLAYKSERRGRGVTAHSLAVDFDFADRQTNKCKQQK